MKGKTKKERRRIGKLVRWMRKMTHELIDREGRLKSLSSRC